MPEGQEHSRSAVDESADAAWLAAAEAAGELTNRNKTAWTLMRDVVLVPIYLILLALPLLGLMAPVLFVVFVVSYGFVGGTPNLWEPPPQPVYFVYEKGHPTEVGLLTYSYMYVLQAATFGSFLCVAGIALFGWLSDRACRGRRGSA